MSAITRTARTIALIATATAPLLVTADIVSAGDSGPKRTPTCRGQEATHVNTDGTGGDDVIVVTDGNLSIQAWSGNDLICVDTGDSQYGASVRGGPGRDTIISYSGYNSLYGGEDGDSILSNSHDHLLDGEDGSDTIYIGSQPDSVVYGGSGNDRIMGSPGADTVNAGSGDDLVMGFGGADDLSGSTGDDRLVGGAGADELDGGGDTDECVDVAATTFVDCEDEIVIFGGVGGGGVVIAG